MSARNTSRVLYFGPFSTVAAGAAPDVAPADSAGLYYEADTDDLMLSENGGAWAPIGTGIAAGGWTDDGSNVRLSTAADTVSIGTAAPIAGTKLVVSAPQLVTAGLDTTQGIDVAIVRTAPLAAGEFVTVVALHPSGNAADNAASFVAGVFADAPAVSTAFKSVLFVLGDQAGGAFWEEVIGANDNDIVIRNTRQTAGAPDDIVLSVASVAPGGEIRSECDVGGTNRVMWSANFAAGFEARGMWGRRGQLNATVAVNTNNLNPAGLDTTSALVLANTSGADVDITGLAGGAAGRRISLVNGSDVAAETFTLTNEDAASTAANRFHTEDLAAIVIPRGGAVELMYDGNISRWRPLYT